MKPQTPMYIASGLAVTVTTVYIRGPIPTDPSGG